MAPEFSVKEVRALNELWQNVVGFVNENIIQAIRDNISVIAAVDILLLAVILYFVYLFVRERRAGKLLLGLACVFVLSLMGDALDLTATRFVFSDFRQIGLFAILILFQPELRSLLEKVGGTSVSGIRTITSESKDISSLNSEIDAVCTAANDLSRDKTGALIVIERSTKLGEYIKSGVTVDAALSPHLLRNLFFNKAPLHDGAVIIRSGRVCAAGCFLPLTARDDIDKDLGTRHRAALGMSECSDAIVIVVSEETGQISLCVNGDLTRNYNYNTLKQELFGMLAPAIQVESKKHGKKTKNSEKDEGEE